MDAVTNLFLFLILDVVTILFSMIFFKCWANFNFVKMYSYLQKEYGMMMSISQSYLMIHNFCVIITLEGPPNVFGRGDPPGSYPNGNKLHKDLKTRLLMLILSGLS